MALHGLFQQAHCAQTLHMLEGYILSFSTLGSIAFAGLDGYFGHEHPLGYDFLLPRCPPACTAGSSEMCGCHLAREPGRGDGLVHN